MLKAFQQCARILPYCLLAYATGCTLHAAPTHKPQETQTMSILPGTSQFKLYGPLHVTIEVTQERAPQMRITGTPHALSHIKIQNRAHVLQITNQDLHPDDHDIVQVHLDTHTIKQLKSKHTTQQAHVPPGHATELVIDARNSDIHITGEVPHLRIHSVNQSHIHAGELTTQNAVVYAAEKSTVQVHVTDHLSAQITADSHLGYSGHPQANIAKARSSRP